MLVASSKREPYGFESDRGMKGRGCTVTEKKARLNFVDMVKGLGILSVIGYSVTGTVLLTTFCRSI